MSRTLTPREAQVLELIANEGLTTAAIAQRMDIATGTVRTHIQNICFAIGVRGRLEAAAWAWHNGFLIFDAGVRKVVLAV